MRAAFALAILIGTTATAFAAGGFEIVIPGRPGVPIIINGVDASYAVVEGDWGLGKGGQVQTKVYGVGNQHPVPNVGHYYPSAGLVPALVFFVLLSPAATTPPQGSESYHQSWGAQSN